MIFKGKFMSFPVLETNKKKGHFLNKGQELQEEKEKTRKINFSWKTDKEKQTNCFTKKSGTYQSHTCTKYHQISNFFWNTNNVPSKIECRIMQNKSLCKKMLKY